MESLPGAVASVRRLNELFNGNIWIVSKASPATAERARAWLASSGFLANTGVPACNIAFVRERSEKLAVCREHRITHFVDDQLRNLMLLSSFVPHLYLFGEGNDAYGVTGGTTFVPDWAEAESALRRSVCELGRGQMGRDPISSR